MSDDIVARLREDELRLGRAAFDSADAGLSCNLASDAADEIERLRAELAAEREKTQQARDMASIRGLEAAGLSAERDALRAMLMEARGRMAADGWLATDPFMARIDAALKGDDRE